MISIIALTVQRYFRLRGSDFALRAAIFPFGERYAPSARDMCAKRLFSPHQNNQIFIRHKFRVLLYTRTQNTLTLLEFALAKQKRTRGCPNLHRITVLKSNHALPTLYGQRVSQRIQLLNQTAAESRGCNPLGPELERAQPSRTFPKNFSDIAFGCDMRLRRAICAREGFTFLSN